MKLRTVNRVQSITSSPTWLGLATGVYVQADAGGKKALFGEFHIHTLFTRQNTA